MADTYQQIVVKRHGNVACVRLAKLRMDENDVYELSRELHRLAKQEGCPRIALCLGPETPEFLYSVFLAKLIALQRHLDEIGGALKLCQCTPQVIDILDVCVLLDRFDLVDSPATALAQWGVDPTADASPSPEAPQ